MMKEPGGGGCINTYGPGTHQRNSRIGGKGPLSFRLRAGWYRCGDRTARGAPRSLVNCAIPSRGEFLADLGTRQARPVRVHLSGIREKSTFCLETLGKAHEGA